MSDLDRWENEGGTLTCMQSSRRLKALQHRHAQLDARVDVELRRPNPCTIEMRRLKREKLYLKDEMSQLAL